MLVYVINKQGNPIMPCSVVKARKLLKSKKAKIVKRDIFTIQLLYNSSNYKQEINLGIDTGSKIIGISATAKKKELISAECELRNDIVDLLSDRKMYRKARRSRLRYRKVRFDNRVKSKHKGWLAPSIEHKINSHINIIGQLNKILPISKIILEIANFDIQKLNNPQINKWDYQKGVLYNFENVKSYVLHRDDLKGNNNDKN